MSEVFIKVNDDWFTYWVCKRCGHKQQLTIDNLPLPSFCSECGYSGLNIKEEEKSMNNKYNCPICGKEYDTVSEMVDCALACDKKREEDAKALETEKRERARKVALTAIENCYKELEAMVKQFNKDYPEIPVYIHMEIDDSKGNIIKRTSWTNFPNEWSAPLNFNKINSFESIVDAFLKEDK